MPAALAAVAGRYRLLRRLGRGGTGVVYEADDTSSGRRFAIKLVSSTHASGIGTVRGDRLAAEVRHPCVVRNYGDGAYQRGVYLVMELVAGRSLQSILGDGPLGWREATVLLAAACEGVMALHVRGILHCDIKPANLLRAVDGTVKLADFGLARRLGSSRWTASGKGPAGTPHYMSPEQCCEEDLDERTDIYSLGATYHALLTGRTPYADGSPFQVMFAQCSAPIPDPRRGRRDVPAACAEIVMRALRKTRTERYDGAREMRDALRAALRDKRPSG